LLLGSEDGFTVGSGSGVDTSGIEVGFDVGVKRFSTLSKMAIHQESSNGGGPPILSLF
jgi:hypothetical protein